MKADARVAAGVCRRCAGLHHRDDNEKWRSAIFLPPRNELRDAPSPGITQCGAHSRTNGSARLWRSKL